LENIGCHPEPGKIFFTQRCKKNLFSATLRLGVSGLIEDPCTGTHSFGERPNILKQREGVLMRFGWTFVVALALVPPAFAQTPGDELRSRIRAVRYSALAEQARIEGDVHLDVNSGVVTLLSGHPMLVQTAVESAKTLRSVQGKMNLRVVFHFVIVDTVTWVPTSMTVHRGNGLERALLRAFGFKTEKVVYAHECQAGVPPPNTLEITDGVMEIWIYGRTYCLQTVSNQRS
jgi:hypothetical protein